MRNPCAEARNDPATAGFQSTPPSLNLARSVQQSARNGNRTKNNARHCVREGLTVQKTLRYEAEDNAKQRNGSHNGYGLVDLFGFSE